MTDRELAIIVRAALLSIVKALEKKYGLGEHKDEKSVIIEPG
jgi:hypothetical protein